MNLHNRVVWKLTWMVTCYPRWILTTFVLLTVTAVSLLPGLTRNPSPYLLSKAHPSRVNLKLLRENYTGARDAILILLETKESVFKPQTLERIRKLTTALEEITAITPSDLSDFREDAKHLKEPMRSKILKLLEKGLDNRSWETLDTLRGTSLLEGVLEPDATRFFDRVFEKLTPIVEVTSLANTDNILAVNGELDVNPIFREIPITPEKLATMQKKVWDNELFRDILISADGRQTSIIVELAVSDDDTEAQFLIYEKVQKILKKKLPGAETHFIGGLPVVTASIGKTMQTDTTRLFPAVFIIVIICLWITFRMVKGIVVPLLVVICSLVVTLALKVLFHVPINIVSTALPIFIISIGVADGIHIFSEYRDHLLNGLSKVDAIGKTLDHMFMPVVLTSLTTAGAFWSLSITEVVQMRHFGLFVAVGTLVAMIFSLMFIPTLLMVLPMGKAVKRQRQSRIDRWITKSLEHISLMAIRRSLLFVITTCLVVGVAVYGTMLVYVDNNPVRYLPDDYRLVISTQKLNRDGAGSLVLNLLVTTDTSGVDPFKDPERLAILAGLGDHLESHPQVGKVLGLAQLIKRINLVMHDGDPAYNRIPEPLIGANGNSGTSNTTAAKILGRQLISQYLLLYENSGGDTLTDVIDSEYSRVNMPLVLKTNSSKEVKTLIKAIRRYEQTYFPKDMHIDFSGSANVTMAATFEIVRGQMISLLISFFLILLMLMATFRSLARGLFAMIPLGVTVLINFAIMGYAGIPLDIGTAVVSSIVIGIGVDYSIHYLSRLRASMQAGLPFEKAVLKTVRHSGKAITANAFTVGIGFTALLFSVFSPLVTMGWMITTTMIVSAMATIMLFPAFLKTFPILFFSKGKSAGKLARSGGLLPEK